METQKQENRKFPFFPDFLVALRRQEKRKGKIPLL
jgi:hypothetical protein